jgi:hypothetical protein
MSGDVLGQIAAMGIWSWCQVVKANCIGGTVPQSILVTWHTGRIRHSVRGLYTVARSDLEKIRRVIRAHSDRLDSIWLTIKC